MIINETKGFTVADEVRIADTWRSRLKGLLDRTKLGIGEALVLEPCNSVHTCFMKFTIDVLVLNKQNIVIGLYEFLVPYRFTKIHRGASRVVELPAGTISRTKTELGDKLIFQN